MKITDPITSIDIKTETLPSHDTPDPYQRCDSPRFVPSDSVPFSLRQSLLELLFGFCEFRLHLPKTTNRTPTNSTRQEKISCLLISRVSHYSKLNSSTQLVYQRPPLYHEHEQRLKTHTVKPPLIFTMAASTAQNPAVKSESKSAKKKKAAKSTSADIEPLTANPAEATPSNGPTESNSGDGSYESPYIKELYK